MRQLLNRKRGFTLIELMIVVAIIGILAAIAIPNFLQFQLRSKTGEARTNLAGIRTAEESYFAEYGLYVTAAAHPAAPVPTKQQWTAAATHGFNIMGWAPEGSVFFQYATDVGGANNTAYTASALGELDGGGNTSDFGYVKADGAGAGIASTLNACPAGGVYNAVTTANDLLSAVGPCGANDGTSDF
jgi:type IV pilus assembly protein PilA